MWTQRLLRHLLTLLLTLLLGGLLGATLVRLAPGFGVDEQELNARLSDQSIQAVRQARAGERNVMSFYLHYLAAILRGDFGVSRSFGRPVAELFSERVRVTLCSVGLGLVGGWLSAFALALSGALYRRWAYDLLTSLLTGLLLCLPSAVLALVFLYLGGPSSLAIALVVLPRIFRYSRNLLLQTYCLPHVLTAKAKGLGSVRILLWHVLPSAAPSLLALVGVSVSMAFGAAIPIEVLSDSPGIGQLAWQAALGRDLPLLVNMTLFVTLVTLTANSLSDLAGKAFLRHQA